jgi:hypothetical protein
MMVPLPALTLGGDGFERGVIEPLSRNHPVPRSHFGDSGWFHRRRKVKLTLILFGENS